MKDKSATRKARGLTVKQGGSSMEDREAPSLFAGGQATLSFSRRTEHEIPHSRWTERLPEDWKKKDEKKEQACATCRTTVWMKDEGSKVCSGVVQRK